MSRFVFYCFIGIWCVYLFIIFFGFSFQCSIELHVVESIFEEKKWTRFFFTFFFLDKKIDVFPFLGTFRFCVPYSVVHFPVHIVGIISLLAFYFYVS